MGRHARGAARSRVQVATVVLGVLVVVIIAVGSFLGSRTESVPSADVIAASAVVVSSPACPAGSRQTIVDVLSPVDPGAGGQVRAILEGCGYQEGSPLAVQYRAGDPTDVTVAHIGDADAATVALLPLGLTVAGLLAIGAALAVYVDGRRRPFGRRATFGIDTEGDVPDGPGDQARPDARQQPATAVRPAPDGIPDGLEGDRTTPDGAASIPVIPEGPGRHSAVSPDGAVATTSPWAFLADPRSDQFPDRNGHGPFTAGQARTTAAIDHGAPPFTVHLDAAGDVGAPDGIPASSTGRTAAGRPDAPGVDSVLSYPSGLAARLHDELFTHRGVSD